MRNYLIITFIVLISLYYSASPVYGQGVKIVKDITQGEEGTFTEWETSGVFAITGNKLYTYNKEEGKPYRFWITDMDTYDTHFFHQFNYVFGHIIFDNELYMSVKDGSDLKLIKINSDGDIIDVYQGQYHIKNLVLYKNAIYFADGDYLKRYSKTGEISTIHQFYHFGGLRDMTATTDSLFIIGGIEGSTQLFVSDGTAEGTKYYYTINEGSEFNKDIYMTPVGKKVFFFYDKDGEGYRLWVTDGTDEGTLALTEHKTLPFENLKRDKSIIAYKNKLYYRGKSLEGDDCLFVSDGTIEGSKLYIKEDAKKPKFMKIYNDRLYFFARDSWWNYSWYYTEGNASDVKQAFKGYGFIFTSLAEFKGDLLFSGYKSNYKDTDIYRYKKTNNKIVELTNISDNDEEYDPKHMTVYKDKVFFIGISPYYGSELFVYDPTLDGNFPVDITVQPKPATVCEGDSAYFVIKVGNDENFLYQWQKNGNDIEGATTKKYIISSVKVEDKGVYRCVVEGNGGKTTSSGAPLTVKRQINIAEQPQSLDLNQGKEAKFSVSATGNIQSYQWYKDNNPLSDGGNISGATTAELTIKNVSTSDKGKYLVKISGACGDVTSDAATLNVVTATIDLAEAGINIIPNPAKDHINIINTGKKINKIMIYNRTGQLLIQKSQDVKRINISKLTAGLYFIKVVQGDDVSVGRIVVE